MSNLEREPQSIRPLSTEIRDLLARAEHGPLTIGEIEAALKGRGLDLVILVLAVPFLIPNLPGLSSPLGFAVMMLGFRSSLGQKPMLPVGILKRSIPRKILIRSLKFAIALLRRIESLTRQRMITQWDPLILQRVVGVLLMFTGLLLALPLPIPFSNTLPALSIICLTAGAMERDGLFVLIGFVLALFAWGFVAAFFILGEAGIRYLLGF